MTRPRRRKRAMSSIAPIAAALTTFAVSASVRAQGGPPATPVHGAEVQLQELQERRRVTGDLRAVARSLVATIEPGLVVAVPVDEGHLVAKGDPVAVLDARRLEHDRLRLLARAEVETAFVEAAEAELEQSTNDLASLEALLARSASMPKELTDARSEVRIRTAMKLRAEKSLTVTDAELALIGDATRGHGREGAVCGCRRHEACGGGAMAGGGGHGRRDHRDRRLRRVAGTCRSDTRRPSRARTCGWRCGSKRPV